MRLFLDDKEAAGVSANLSLSGGPLYIGDYPGDNKWGSRYNIHQSMTGAVRRLQVTP